MSESSGVPWGRLLATVCLLAFGLAGLAMTVCGLLVIVSGSGFVLVAFGAVAIGALCIYGAYQGIRGMSPETPGARPPHDFPPSRP